MRRVNRSMVLWAILALVVTLPAWAQRAAAPRGDALRAPQSQPMDPAAADPGARAQNDARKAQIKALDEQIKSLRDQYHAQADPLDVQLKSLRAKLDGEIQPLQAQRKDLVEQGESPARRALDQEEADKLTQLAAQEKADVDKVHAQYAEQRKAIQQDYQQRRRDLESPAAMKR